MSRFKKASRQKAKLRLAIDGPAGSGKSYTALRFAFAFPGARVACIEAGENGGLSLYQGLAPDDVPFNFDILELKGDYSPTKYTEAINEAGREKYDVLVIDSLSHAWTGEGGALDIKDRQGGNSFTAWKDVTPMHNRMIDAILQSPCHVIATMRSKTEYVLEEVIDSNGRKKQVPVKKAMAPIQRSGMEYEFTIYASMDQAHVMTVTKSRCPLVQDAILPKPGVEFMSPVLAWLETGDVAPVAELPKRAGAEQVRRIEGMIRQLGVSEGAVKKSLAKYGAASVALLLTAQADEIEAKLKDGLAKAEARKAAATAAVNGETATAAVASTEADSGTDNTESN